MGRHGNNRLHYAITTQHNNARKTPIEGGIFLGLSFVVMASESNTVIPPVLDPLHLAVCLYVNLGVSRRCVFPFQYRGVLYQRCTSDHSSNGEQWCATSVARSVQSHLSLVQRQRGSALIGPETTRLGSHWSRDYEARLSLVQSCKAPY